MHLALQAQICAAITVRCWRINNLHKPINAVTSNQRRCFLIFPKTVNYFSEKKAETVKFTMKIKKTQQQTGKMPIKIRACFEV